MQHFNVTGMTCAACQARVEKAVNKVNGVTSCSVSLLTNSMGVEGDVNPNDIIKAVDDAGYKASLKNSTNTSTNSGSFNSPEYDLDSLKDHESPQLLKRLVVSVFFLIILMYFSMGHMMWNWPIPEFFVDNHIAMGLLQLLLSGIIMVINQRFFINGFKSFIKGSPNMDTLVAMGSMVSFLWSVYMLFVMTRAYIDGNHELVMKCMMNFYFEAAATIVTLITVGKMLEAKSKGRTTDALKSLIKLSPKEATVIRDNVELTIPAGEVIKGDIFIVKPGESIPVDGIVIEGHSAVNESALTGESIPVDKMPKSSVSAATINQSGFLRCEATRVGNDTTLSQIIKLVSEAAATKAPIAKIADKVSGIFVPTVLIISFVTTLIWFILGMDLGYALERGISVLVISCPCSLGLATPVAIMVGSGCGAKKGILYKTAVALEETGRIQIVALDKTGTITSGNPQVTDIIPADNCTLEEFLGLAASLELKSEHPLAKAIVNKAKAMNLSFFEVSNFEALVGNGLKASYEQNLLLGGSLKFITSKIDITNEIIYQCDKLSDQGKTPLLFAKDNTFLGIIAVADVIKDDSSKAIKELENMGIQAVMITGDNYKTANAIAKQAGIHNVIAGVLPDEKEKAIKELQKQGKTAMVGDGINDALALTSADIGIAIGAGTDVAIDAANVVLMNNSLSDVSKAIRLSRQVLKNIHENLFWAFIYNIIGIPLAAGVFIPILGWQLSPMFGAAAMSLSSFCVVSNALRLNLFNIDSNNKDKKTKKQLKSLDFNNFSQQNTCCEQTENIQYKEDVNKNINHLDSNENQNINHKNDKIKKQNNGGNIMTKTIIVDGMMCGHCEARVKKTLEKIDGIESATANHENNTVEISFSKDIDEATIEAAITEQDYIYKGVQA